MFEPTDRLIGYEAPLHRSLFQPRTKLGLPRELLALLWGLGSIPMLAWHIFSVLLPYDLPIGLVTSHIILAYVGRKNPNWFRYLKRYLRHGRHGQH